VSAVEVAGSVLLLSGALLSVLAAIGLLVLPDVGARLQATTKPQVLGLALVCAGAGLLVEDRTGLGLLALAVLFQLVTAPVLAQVVGRSAYRSGAIRRDRLLHDDLAAEDDDRQ
jgi:multicomponent Na+:H+ antiporter subunit G